MKKLLAFALALTLLFTLPACDKKSAGTAEADPSPTALTVAQETDEALWFIPGYKVVKSGGEVLTLTEPQSFDFMGIGEETLTHAVFASGVLWLVFAGEYTDEREPKGTKGGSGGDSLDFLTLRLGDNEYTCGTYSSYVDSSNLAFGTNCSFDLPQDVISAGEECALIIDQLETNDWYQELTFTLEKARSVNSLFEVVNTATGFKTEKLYAENSYIRMAAVPERSEGALAVTLYGESLTGMEIVSYGGNYEFGVSKPVTLQSGGDTLYSSFPSPVYKLFYPVTWHFDAKSGDLNVPCVMLADDEDIIVTHQFSTKEEALAYSETIGLGRCQITLTIEENGDYLELMAGVVGLEEGLTPRRLEYCYDPAGDDSDSTHTTIFYKDNLTRQLGYSDDETLASTLQFSVHLQGVVYEAGTNFDFAVEPE